MGLRVGLDEGCEDLGVLPEVTEEGIATPAPHDLHGLQWHTSEQVEEGGTDPDAMSLKGLQAGLTSSRGQALDEGWLSEGAELIFVAVGKEVGAGLRGVDSLVIAEGFVWVGGAWVSAPEHVFTV